MAVVKIRPRDLKPGDRWLHWTGTKHVTLPVADVHKKRDHGTTVYKVRLDVPHRDRNHISAYRTVRPNGWVEIWEDDQ